MVVFSVMRQLTVVLLPLFTCTSWFSLCDRYRLGHSRGAKGDVAELSARLSVAHARLLPVGQLSALINAKPRRSFSQLEKAPFHLHIGAGRLGLGLVLPAICQSEVQFAIIQRPSSAWDTITKSPSQDVTLYVNDEVRNDSKSTT